MPADAAKRKSDLVRNVIRECRRKVRGAKAARLESFLKQYLANVPLRDVAGKSLGDLFALAENHLAFAESRKRGKPMVRAFNSRQKTHGYESDHTVIEIITDDMPFLVDSVTTEINRQGLTAFLIIHPILSVRRTPAGKFQEILEHGHGVRGVLNESFMHLEVTQQSGKRLGAIEAGLKRVLSDVRAAVEDWRLMRATMADLIEEFRTAPRGVHSEEVDESREFLRWIHDDHFTFLGFREYNKSGSGRKASFKIDKTTGLGVLRDPKLSVFENWDRLDTAPPEVSAFVNQPNLLMVTKSNHRSTIHRPAHMDAIGVKRFDKRGRVVGLRLYVGLFTSIAYHRSPRDIPLLRRRMQVALDRAGFPAGSHDSKSLANVLETFPRDELFQIDDDTLFDTAMGIMHLQDRQQTALFTRHDKLGRYVSCLVYVPRDRYTTELRRRIQEILAEELQGRIAAFFTQLGESLLARCHIIVPMLSGGIPKYDQAQIEARLLEASRSWSDQVQDALVGEHGEELGLDMTAEFADAFGPAYQDQYGSSHVAIDIAKLQQMRADNAIAMHLYRSDGAADANVRFKIYHPGDPIPLSDALPVFEHMGFTVVSETPHEIALEDGGHPVMIHDFELEARGQSIDLDDVGDNLMDAFFRVWTGEIESDGFNALVPQSDLTWRQVVVLRAYCKYLRQAGIPFSQTYMEQTLANNAGLARDIVNMFTVGFDPAATRGAAARLKRIRARLDKGLETVVSADEDRILRRFINAVESTLRTNFYQTAEDGGNKPYLSFKLNSQNIDELPLPRPLREIFVYSPRVEGVHLRFGMVARGGLRWSDRREDFRTEVLGLVKAQQVKNAVIVPVGSKGGFVVKRPPATGGRDAFMEEGIACYRTFISGLLDITDNIRGPKIVPPKNVIRRDGDDPYLVVAADKGTATFSDIANAVSLDYGHWLGDAFASGGSQGYDHKKMGITARGAWESVKRHFREMDKDIQKQDFTVAGVGDMAGDVFGNGMLLSKHIKLLAAYNHLHIFVDPDPDSAKSYVERKRLFNLPRSAWTDYDKKAMSKGGAIYERSAKSLKLTPQIMQCFGIEKSQVTPNELLRHILKSEVELMWFGGIGTYIKSSVESNLDAGDRANDPIRVNGNELRCKVIGEGANLGCTQLGRIEFALAGGRMNTDSIDNSAGVDSSDHEVNIKILVDTAMAAGGLTQAKRNALLASMTNEVGELVLIHNYRQTQALTVIESKGVMALENQQRLMRRLERADRLDRSVEFLPDDETLGERALAHQGLCRPELSVLLSYAKIWLYDEMMASDMPDDPYLLDDLIDYFPTPLRKKYARGIAGHRLRREIIATRATNSLIDRAGCTFISEFVEKTGLGADAIARAYIIARQVFQLRGLWQDIEALDNKISANTQTAMLADVNQLIEWVTLWFLRNGKRGLDLGAHIKEFSDGIATLAGGVNKALPTHYVRDARTRAQPYMDKGVPEAVALRVAGLVNLYSGCDIVRLAARRKMSVLDVARVYFAVGTRFKLGRLRAAADHMEAESHWQQLAVAALIEEVYSHQLSLAGQVLDVSGGKVDPHRAIDTWIDKNRLIVEPTEQLLTELWATEVNDLSMVAVASRQIRTMTEAPD